MYLFNLHNMYKCDFYLSNTHKYFSLGEFAVRVCNAMFVFTFSGYKHCCVGMHGLTQYTCDMKTIAMCVCT